RYLTKPVKQSDLLDAILAALAATSKVPTSAPSAEVRTEVGPTPVPFTPLRILVVDDNATNQMLVVRILEKEGHQITVAGNGREGLEKVGITEWRWAGEKERGAASLSDSDPKLAPPCFDVVLMDVQMPEMDGLEATGIIRAHERDTGARLPVIAMTAHAMK